MEEIINKVAQSGLVIFNLEDYYDPAERVCIDFKDYLTAIPIGDAMNYILREKSFRESINQLDVRVFEQKNVAITCSVDAIIPTWAYMLLSMTIQSTAKKVIVGNIELLENILLNDALNKVNIQEFANAKVIIKGCNKYNIPVYAYVQIANLLKPYAKSIMFGEPCSTVPLYKKNRNDLSPSD